MTRKKTGRHENGLIWPPLIAGTLIKRYKRFMVDIRLKSGDTVTAHCPNTGSMQSCCEPGRPVYLSCHDHPKRKFKYTWEMIEMPKTLVGVNTATPNRLVFESVKNGAVEALAYDVRIDLQGISLHRRLPIDIDGKAFA